LYKLKDGWLYVAAETPEARRGLCQAFGIEDLTHAQADGGLAQTLMQRFATLSLVEGLQRLKEGGVPCAPSVEGQSEIFLSDPHATANDLVATHSHPILGRMRVARHYVRCGHTAVVQGRPTPLLGEHTREVLREVGFPERALDELHAKGVVKTEVAGPGR
jgi:crotonobetainyl-CoA:carnitine CoA-transferase CaiB-like acyl-CoA transferase